MKRRQLLKSLATIIPTLALSGKVEAGSLFLDRDSGNLASGPFLPNWESLSNYKTPDWFRDAKFGIWAHWGPQCEPECGDWYGRSMYLQGSRAYNHHVKNYGHPSKSGFKDVINEWRPDKWDPEYLVSLYKKAGARYFMGMANHHDNFDLFDSRHQRWNSTKIGPKKDIVGGWARAAKRNGLPFGVSIHASHAWNWYEPAQLSDRTGPLANIPYDGNVLAHEGKGKWWDGYDPQDLYAQRHPISKRDNSALYLSFDEWKWGGQITRPSKEFITNVYNRTLDLIDRYDPDMLYFDDTVLPFWPFDDTGLKILAHMYNRSIRKKGMLNAVVTGKFLDEVQRKSLVWDFERASSNEIEPLPWQTDTCLGDWHYDRDLYEKNKYKSAKTVIHTLIDVVSKNGNLMLNIPVRGDGSIDDKELLILEGITEWMRNNGYAIYATRPWKIAGEGTSFEGNKNKGAMSEHDKKGFNSSDIRFTQKGDFVYAFVLGKPSDVVAIRSLSSREFKSVTSVKFVGTGEQLQFKQSDDGLSIALPRHKMSEVASAFQIS